MVPWDSKWLEFPLLSDILAEIPLLGRISRIGLQALAALKVGQIPFGEFDVQPPSAVLVESLREDGTPTLQLGPCSAVARCQI